MRAILIIGGTGSLGQALTPLLLDHYPEARIRVLSRGEHAQMEMAEKFKSDKIDFMVGDVRDYRRIKRACMDANVVFHFAAMKSVDKAEYDPQECVKTNIEGTQNVVDACIENGVERAIFTSSDKAVAPLNLYGATKLVAEKLFQEGNIGRHQTRFGVARYGNVFGSNGSVIQKWKAASEIEVTDPQMTRFFISLPNAARFVLSCYQSSSGGEISIPIMKSTSLLELAEAFEKPIKIVGERPGEKKHECLVAADEWRHTTLCGNHFKRWPTNNLFKFEKEGVDVHETLDFTSDRAKRFTKEELKEMILGVP